MQNPSLPPVTDAHRRAAFEAMHWRGWSFEAAMHNDTRRRVIEARAHHMRTTEYTRSQSRTTAIVKRHNPSTSEWRTQRVAGEWAQQMAI